MRKPAKPSLYSRIHAILESARVSVARSVNTTQVIANWLVGREIVEDEQHGAFKAEYGKRIITDLSKRLQDDFGAGYSTPNLFHMRKFYSEYPGLVEFPEILYAVRRESAAGRKFHAVRRKSSACLYKDPAGSVNADGIDGLPFRHGVSGESWKPGVLHPNLSWTHYRTLLKVIGADARTFYEIETIKSNWSARQLERQIHSLLFERLLKSRDKKGVIALANKGIEASRPIDIIKDPYVLEFLNLPESHQLVETKVETALISRLQDFLLELGSGFAFIGRQKRLTLEGDHFYPDLVFYHIKLRCYVIIDLKTQKLTHGDLGQMQMYVHYYDREIKSAADNPSIGLILCTEKNDAVVKYVLDEKQRQIFTSRYQQELPKVEDLQIEMRRSMEVLSTTSRPPAPRQKSGNHTGIRSKGKSP